MLISSTAWLHKHHAYTPGPASFGARRGPPLGAGQELRLATRQGAWRATYAHLRQRTMTSRALREVPRGFAPQALSPLATPLGDDALQHVNQPVLRSERLQLIGYYGVIAGLHVLGWGVYLTYARQHPSLIGLGFAAYAFGLRHAFDADHIAAVDDTVRLMLQRGLRPLGVGFFFSLGHASVVFALALGIGLAAGLIERHLPGLQAVGAIVGSTISGLFLLVIGLLNLRILLDLLKLWRHTRQPHSHDHVDDLLAQRGLMNRLLGARRKQLIGASWQMYPLGILFGLGFDTASEVGLLALTAGAAAGQLPFAATLSLPILFAAGMSLMDTTDGVLMVKAYQWAFVNPTRKLQYNLTTTGLSVVVALVIGSIELLQVVMHWSKRQGGAWRWIDALDLGALGYVIVAAFLLAWLVSVWLWRRAARHEPSAAHVPAEHLHGHADGRHHAHRHFE